MEYNSIRRDLGRRILFIFQFTVFELQYKILCHKTDMESFYYSLAGLPEVSPAAITLSADIPSGKK